MPKCKYCGAQISKFDKDICPLCGERKPLEGIMDETVDFTNVMDAVSGEEHEVTYKNRIVAGVLAIIFGFLGIHNFYVCKIKLALINLLESAVAIGGIGSALYFLTGLGVWGYLIPYFLVLAYDVWVGVTYFTRNDLKDGRGEIMR